MLNRTENPVFFWPVVFARLGKCSGGPVLQQLYIYMRKGYVRLNKETFQVFLLNFSRAIVIENTEIAFLYMHFNIHCSFLGSDLTIHMLQPSHQTREGKHKQLSKCTCNKIGSNGYSTTFNFSIEFEPNTNPRFSNSSPRRRSCQSLLILVGGNWCRFWNHVPLRMSQDCLIQSNVSAPWDWVGSAGIGKEK